MRHGMSLCTHYNIPSNNRELQLMLEGKTAVRHYNIPSNNRELQPASTDSLHTEIITYQVITGNYSLRYFEKNIT